MKFESSARTAKGEPRKTNKAWVERVIARFMETGYSNHSPLGHFLAPLLNHCVRNRIAFTLYHVPGGGYFVRRGHIGYDDRDVPIKAT